MNLSDVVVVSAVRTPMGKFGGSLRGMQAYDIGAVSIKEAVRRSGLSAAEIDSVILGNCRQAGNGPNPSRTAAVRGGIDESVPSFTLNMACPSGMKAIELAANSIMLKKSTNVLAGGFESMSNIPYLLKGARWDGFKMGNKTLEDGWSDSTDPLINQGMGETAENLNTKYNITREEQDDYAIFSHAKASTAQKNGWFDDEIIPIKIPSRNREEIPLFDRDETIRYDIDRKKISNLQPVFRKEGTVTAANSCGLSDGSVAMVVTSRENALRAGINPLFSIRAFAELAVEPSFMGDGPSYSIPKVLKNAGMTLDDIDLIEINEAFAIQVLANQKSLGIDPEKLNIHGGAIALGHPTGISGARIIITLYYALKRLGKTYGLASICGGGGVSTAMIIRRES